MSISLILFSSHFIKGFISKKGLIENIYDNKCSPGQMFLERERDWESCAK